MNYVRQQSNKKITFCKKYAAVLRLESEERNKVLLPCPPPELKLNCWFLLLKHLCY